MIKNKFEKNLREGFILMYSCKRDGVYFGKGGMVIGEWEWIVIRKLVFYILFLYKKEKGK